MEVICKAFLPFDNHAHTKEEFFQECSTFLSARLNIPATELAAALNNREALSTTGFGEGMAIPHGEIASLEDAYVIFFRFIRPVEWEAMDDQPVTDCFLLLVPAAGKNDLHLRLLSTLAYHLADESHQHKIRTIQQADLMEEYLQHMMQPKREE